MQRFGEKIRILRLQNQMTLQELAFALGLKAHGYMSEIESGKKKPTTELVVKVARLFNITTDHLLIDEMDILEIGRNIQTSRFDQHPTPGEVEKIRLLLSTYQDGSGQLVVKGNRTLPGWRDFERTIAAVFNGLPQENKSVFDVLVPDHENPELSIGISCKMRCMLDEVKRIGRVSLELSNSAGKFWREIESFGLNQQKYKKDPQQVGKALILLVKRWHNEVSIESGGLVDLNKSYYLVLSWNQAGSYQLFKFNLSFPDPEELEWDFPAVKGKSGSDISGRRLRGMDNSGALFEWYGESGGQLKYYPTIEAALWKSDVFRLEPISESMLNLNLSMVKAQRYFPNQWAAVNQNPPR